jgi:hypothetical protein
MKMDLKIIQKACRLTRLNNNLSIREMSELTGISYGKFYHFENNRTNNAEILIQYINLLGWHNIIYFYGVIKNGN